MLSIINIQHESLFIKKAFLQLLVRQRKRTLDEALEKMKGNLWRAEPVMQVAGWCKIQSFLWNWRPARRRWKDWTKIAASVESSRPPLHTTVFAQQMMHSSASDSQDHLCFPSSQICFTHSPNLAFHHLHYQRTHKVSVLPWLASIKFTLESTKLSEVYF